MNHIKRWTVSVTSWVDGVLAQIENHEASVTTAIGRVRQSAARAKVQLKRVERDQRALRDALQAEEDAVEAWRRRAKDVAEEATALECVRRLKSSERRVRALRQRLLEHERAHKDLSEGTRMLSSRLSELIERRNLMRTRQSRAEATHGLASATGPIGDLEDVFERWETRVAEVEIASECELPIDSFEADFEEREQDAELLVELEALRREEG